ncbi:MAG: EamA family transporter RarD [Rhizobiales bacterium]|nr:EamA family transporter RarD [Hyphomicrobiales bacterium]
MSESEKGVALAVMAHLVWGGMAVYFGLIRHISPVEIAASRGLWALPIALAIVWYLGQFSEVRKALANPRMVATLALTSCLIVFNWGFYIWSIEVGRTLESSMGYFINPLLNVVVGYLFLGERFTRPQMVALALAVVAVLIQTISAGVFPWLGLMLATTFCLYGFLRKTIAVGPTEGFLIETAIIALPLLGAELWLASRGATHFGDNAFDTLMLAGSGVLTAASLMLYAASIRRLRYSTAGLLQYLSPSLVFLTAVFIFREPIGGAKLASFAIIWLALAIFSWSALRGERNRRSTAEPV